MKRKTIAIDTLKIIDDGHYVNNDGTKILIKAETEFAVANSVIFRPNYFDSEHRPIRNFKSTKIEVTDETTLEAAKRLCIKEGVSDPFVLNFASAKNPGGGFLGGAQAQEESLARSSSLYPCLIANREMYDYNRRGSSCFYSDYMIYSPKVPVFKNDDGSLLMKPYLASFMTSPAVNAGVVRQRETDKLHLIDVVNQERAKKVLRIANEKEHDALILGAWGCGVFRNDPVAIAKIFHQLITECFDSCFRLVVMAIYDSSLNKRVFNAFADQFSQ